MLNSRAYILIPEKVSVDRDREACLVHLCSFIHSQILSSTNHHTPGIATVEDLRVNRTDVSPALMACML